MALRGSYPIQAGRGRAGPAEHRRVAVAAGRPRRRRVDGGAGGAAAHVPAGRAVAVHTSAQVLGVLLARHRVLDDPADSWWGTPRSFPDASGFTGICSR